MNNESGSTCQHYAAPALAVDTHSSAFESIKHFAQATIENEQNWCIIDPFCEHPQERTLCDATILTLPEQKLK